MSPPEAGSAPLAGVRVAVTRPAEGAGDLARLLEAEGALPLVLPLVRIEALAEGGLRPALAQVADYAWVVFTSASAVRAVHTALQAQAVPLSNAPRRVAAVGPATAAVVRQLLGWRVDAVPEPYTGAAVAAAMEAVAPLTGARVLWPRAESARDVLPRDLEAAGALLDAPVAYRTVLLPDAAATLAGYVQAGAVDVLTFTSPSAVHAFCLADAAVLRAVVAVIGSTTAAAARQKRLPVHVEPEQHTIAALVAALRDHLGARLHQRQDGEIG
jgi:uroporphyrinogen-III synthase